MSEVEGLQELQSKLKEIAKVLSTEEFLKSAKDGMAIHVEGPAKRNTAIDTGRLRNSEATVIAGDQVITGTNVEYAPFVEYGTSSQSAQPYLRPAWDEGKSKVVSHMETAAQDKLRRVV